MKRETVAELLDLTAGVVGPAWVEGTRDQLAGWLDGAVYLETRERGVEKYVRWLREAAAWEPGSMRGVDGGWRFVFARFEERALRLLTDAEWRAMRRPLLELPGVPCDRDGRRIEL